MNTEYGRSVDVLAAFQSLAVNNIDKIYDRFVATVNEISKKEVHLKGIDQKWKDRLYYEGSVFYLDDNFCKAVSMLVATPLKEEFSRQHNIFCEKMGIEENKQFPFIVVYGVYEPCSLELDDLWVNDWPHMIIGNDCWGNTDKLYEGTDYKWAKPGETGKSISFNFSQFMDPDQKKKWFTKATVKIVRISDITDQTKVEKIVKDLQEMKITS